MKYYRGVEEVSPTDVCVEAVCRNTSRGGIETLKNSFIQVGIKPGFRISVTTTINDESEMTGFRFTVIDGSHRLLALKQLAEEFPDEWGKVKIEAMVYENLPLPLVMLAAEEANKASQVHVATSGADRLFFMHQVITKIIPAAPSDVATSTQGRGKRRAGARLNVVAVQNYLKSLGFVSLGKNIFTVFFIATTPWQYRCFNCSKSFVDLSRNFRSSSIILISPDSTSSWKANLNVRR
jgi:hypothetical protein